MMEDSVYQPEELNRFARAACQANKPKYRVDYCNRLGSLRLNFARHVDSYQEAVTMADGLFHDGAYSVCVTRERTQ